MGRQNQLTKKHMIKKQCGHRHQSFLFGTKKTQEIGPLAMVQILAIKTVLNT